MMDFIDRQTVIMKEYNEFKNKLIIENKLSLPVSTNETPSPTRGFQMCVHKEVFHE